MESFEHVVKVFYEAQDYAVSTNVKFPIRRRTKKAIHAEYQEHGYEVDIVAARRDELVLATVKSYFGSKGVHPASFPAIGWGQRRPSGQAGGYKMLVDPEVREGLLQGAASRYGYAQHQIHFALVAGRFAIQDGSGERAIRDHLSTITIGGGPVRVVNAAEVAAVLLDGPLSSGTYLDDPVITTIRLLAEADRLK